MLTRQKIALALLDKHGESLDRIPFVKLMFLLRHETELGKIHSYYDFLPYFYGPFSFALYRELDILEQKGYLTLTPESISLTSRMSEIDPMGTCQINGQYRKYIDVILNNYAQMSQESLIETVYRKYPWYAINTKYKRLKPRNTPSPTVAEKRIYTLGYEGRSVDSMLNGILHSGIKAIIDIRANPISRKYGFAKNTLQNICNNIGIDYHHVPSLGIPSSLRAGLTDFDSYQCLLDRYENKILSRRTIATNNVIDLIAKKPSALLCMEKDPTFCHRSRLAQSISNKTNLPIVHL